MLLSAFVVIISVLLDFCTYDASQKLYSWDALRCTWFC